MVATVIFNLILFSLTFSSVAAVDYFPGDYFDSSDVAKVTWAHGVNSLDSLSYQLQDKPNPGSAQMLECHVVIGTLVGETAAATLVLADPPANQSDLSLDRLLQDLKKYNKYRTTEKRKGVKLNMRGLPAAQWSLAYLGLMNFTSPSELKFPVLLHADILLGPGSVPNDTVIISGTDFIGLQRLFLPRGTLSLGWTTNMEEWNSKGTYTYGYTRKQFNDMTALVRDKLVSGEEKVKADVTFPLRATFALNSVANIKYLLEESGIGVVSPSVTLWEEANDPKVTQEQLDTFLHDIGKSRVFVNMPWSFPKSNGRRASEIEVKGIFLPSIFVVMYLHTSF